MSMRILSIAILLAGLFAGSATAQYVDQPLSDPQLERRAQVLHKEIRCLVCRSRIQMPILPGSCA